VEEAQGQLEREYKVKTSYLRLKAYPFNQQLIDFVHAHERVYVVDQNRDGQLLQLIRLDQPQLPTEKLRSVRYYGGMPLDARTVTDLLVQQEGL
ncbi:MAG: 2-oxoacid:acceptor oxidoreductase subunit alpha, partial [Acidobacteria bacterium]|nr:2-oxoacid:acceptor oxidoreductase subunit alpha [Acidobacteriota bacterium]